MAGIFVSYRLEDFQRTRPIVDALRVRGYEVRWDAGRIAASGSRFTGFDDAVASSELTLFLWSTESVQSPTLLAQAKRALEGGKYLGVLLDHDVRLPGFLSDCESVSMCGLFPPGEETGWLFRKVGEFVGVPMDVETAKISKRRADNSEADWELWHAVRQADTVAGYEIYLKRYGCEGESYFDAVERLRTLTTPLYRCWRAFDTGAGKLGVIGTMAAAFVGIYIAFYPTAPADSVPRAEFAELESQNSVLQNSISAERALRIGMAVKLANSVTKAEFVALSERATESEHTIAELNAELADMHSVETRNIAQLDVARRKLNLVTLQRDQYKPFFDAYYGDAAGAGSGRNRE